MANDSGVNIKYWKCSRCRAGFTTQAAAQAHTCTGGASIVEVQGEEALKMPMTKKQ